MSGSWKGLSNHMTKPPIFSIEVNYNIKEVQFLFHIQKSISIKQSDAYSHITKGNNTMVNQISIMSTIRVQYMSTHTSSIQGQTIRIQHTAKLFKSGVCVYRHTHTKTSHWAKAQTNQSQVNHTCQLSRLTHDQTMGLPLILVKSTIPSRYRFTTSSQLAWIDVHHYRTVYNTI